MSRELKPCGTRSAYDRHRKRGEKPCEACVEANRLTFREASAKRRRALELPAVELKVVARAADGVGPCAMPENGFLWDPQYEGEDPFPSAGSVADGSEGVPHRVPGVLGMQEGAAGECVRGVGGPYPAGEGGAEVNQFFESSVVPASFPESHVRPEEQVSARLADERLERRERARARVNSRTGDRRGT